MNLLASKTLRLCGEISMPGDKSISHRAALLSSLADGESCITNFLSAGVTEVMLTALKALSIEIIKNDHALIISGKGIGGYQTPQSDLFCGNSATTARFLTGALAASGTSATLDGSAGLRKRPMNRIVQPLQQMGVLITASKSGTMPLVLTERQRDIPLKALDHILPVASAQVKSCLLLAALSADGETILHEPGPSRDHTERMLGCMGARLSSKFDSIEYTTTISPTAKLSPINFIIPGDVSSAAFLIVAALIVPESELRINNVGLNPTRTGLIDALKSMDADISISNTREQCGEPVGDMTVHASKLSATQISGDLVVRMIDEFPIFAIAAGCASGTTIVKHAEELRFKESDRINMLCKELRAIGIDAAETIDGFIIHGGKPLCGGQVNPHGDHRLAMSLAAAGLVTEKPIYIDDADCIKESFPGFVETLISLGANMKSNGSL